MVVVEVPSFTGEWGWFWVLGWCGFGQRHIIEMGSCRRAREVDENGVWSIGRIVCCRLVRQCQKKQLGQRNRTYEAMLKMRRCLVLM